MSESALVVGLTGGIASGKSAASDEFARLGAGIVDTDLLAREIVAAGQPALAEIVDYFGLTVLDNTGQLDRRQLRKRVFTDPTARLALESFTHPRIRQLAAERVKQSVAAYVIVVVPLLTAQSRYSFIDRILVVDVDPEIQLARLLARDDLTEELARAMIAAQADRALRLACADDVIDNSTELAALHAQVAELHARYLSMAALRRK